MYHLSISTPQLQSASISRLLDEYYRYQGRRYVPSPSPLRYTDQFLNTPWPTGSIHRYSTSIHILDDDSLIHVFYLYRLVHLGGDEDDILDLGGNGVRERWWYKLAQICRRWRSIILGSASYLGLRLVCTNGTPVVDMLAHSPPFPLIIDFIHKHHDRDIAAEDEEGMIFALQQRNRVRSIHLRMPVRSLQRFIIAIDEEYPMLESLVTLHPTGDNGPNLILPQTFQAPHLRRLALSGFAFPIGSPFLTTAVGLVTLRLYLAHPSAYLQPRALLQYLSTIPQLETLVIGFSFAVPNRDVERQLLRVPIRIHVTFPNLRYFTFQGVRAYLEALVHCITTPRLEKLGIVLFNQLTFPLPGLLQFMKATESLRFHSATFEFSNMSIRVVMYPRDAGEKWAFRMDVDCVQVEWQVSSVAQIFNALSQALFSVEHLTLKVGRGNLSPGLKWRHKVDRTEWRRLLRSFDNVKTLFVDYPLVADLSRCLRLEGGDLPLELLPELQELVYSGISIGHAFDPFIDSRRNAGRPVTLVRRAQAHAV